MFPYLVDYDYERSPRVTQILVAVVFCTYIWEFTASEEVLDSLVLWPDRFAPWQWVTSPFLHISPFHFAGNLLFLWVYGRYLEERLGRWRFIFLLFALVVVQNTGYFAASIGDVEPEPALGASGIISGMAGLVAVTATGARIKTLFVLGPLVRVVRVPGLIVLVVWLSGQGMLGAIGSYGVTFSTHLAGLLAGVAAGLLLRSEKMAGSGWHLGEHVDRVIMTREVRDAVAWEAVADYTRGLRDRTPPE